MWEHFSSEGRQDQIKATEVTGLSKQSHILFLNN